MLFNSQDFLLTFFPLALAAAIFASLFGRRWYLGVVVIASLIFYGWNDQKNLLIILASMAVNFLGGRLVAKKAVWWTTGSVIFLNLALLAWFKYRLFLLGIDGDLVLPLAISFFTFQQIAYIVEIHRRNIQPFPLLDYVFCVTFFPHLIAGPIINYSQIRSQILNHVPLFKVQHWEVFPEAAAWITIGLVKKILLADNLAPFATDVFNGVNPPTTIDAWLGSYFFTLQIFLDFSAYCEIAIGLGLLLGIRLPLNFDAPYRSRSVTEFWRRWHITLSSFLRTHLYFPLGGNRLGWSRQVVAIMVTMVLGGIWHGAGWNFLFWGAAHGVWIVATHAWRKTFLFTFPPMLSWALTFLMINLLWVPFRAPDLSRHLDIWSAMAGFPAATAVPHMAPPGIVWGILIVATVISLLMPGTQHLVGMVRGRVWRISALGATFGLCVSILVLTDNNNQFIYFEF